MLGHFLSQRGLGEERIQKRIPDVVSEGVKRSVFESLLKSWNSKNEDLIGGDQHGNRLGN